MFTISFIDVSNGCDKHIYDSNTSYISTYIEDTYTCPQYVPK